MNAWASAKVAGPLARVLVWLDDAWLDDAWLDDFDAVFLGAVCARAVQAASRTTFADLRTRFENIAPPVGHETV
jgi:hypothetical protein